MILTSTRIKTQTPGVTGPTLIVLELDLDALHQLRRVTGVHALQIRFVRNDFEANLRLKGDLPRRIPAKVLRRTRRRKSLFLGLR